MTTYRLPFPVSTQPKNGHWGAEYLDTGAKRANPHLGTDFAPGAGAAIPAVAAGTVVARSSSPSKVLGYTLEVLHEDGVYALYCHMRAAAAVGAGARVELGQTVGYVGATGAVTGAHLHLAFSWTKGGGSVIGATFDPIPYIAARSDPAAEEARRAQVRAIAAFLNQHAANLGRATTDADQDGVPGPRYWTLVQALGRAWGFYTGGIDGDPGPLTYAAEAHIWSTWVNLPPAAPAPEPQPAPEPTPVEQPVEQPAPEPQPEIPATPEPEEEPVTDPTPVRPPLSDEQLQAILATATKLGLEQPEQPIIPDKIAKPLWIALALAGITVPYAIGLTVIDWAAWGPSVAAQVSGATVGWLGLIGATLGLSRYAKTRS
ncbi:M23 family metallopeptidase [Protaetiibacter larvae]|uniref:M23 family metallopeptidase n=1 Tax=Protaetiibacter larvae TaxID=2592654 RepID=A0A5C1Y545_9MICO|nr:M23 family metallopeptidase [Protaetiibacter larvae]QEO08881.1 M23 family metallopeptidase [Protaetiibacter larvae]